MGKCPYPGINIHFTYNLVSQYNVFPHLRHEVPQGKIQNLITMQIPLRYWGAGLLLTSWNLQSFLSAAILFHIASHTCVYFPEALFADGYIALNLSTTYKSTPWACHSHAGSTKETTFRSWLRSVSSCLTIILWFRSSVDSHSWNYHLFHRVVCVIFVMVLFFYWVLRG